MSSANLKKYWIFLYADFLKLNFKECRRGFIVKYTSWVIIDEVLYFLDFSRSVLADCGALRDKSSDKSILILVWSSLWWAIRMTIINCRSLLAWRREFHTVCIGELGAVITSEGLEDLTEIASTDFTFYMIQSVDGTCGRLILCNKDELHPCFSLGER